MRLFGDPFAQGGEIPIQIIRLNIELETKNELLVHEPSLDVVCDFVDGKAFGDAFGITLRSVSGWWTVKRASIRNTKVPSDSLLSLAVNPFATTGSNSDYQT
ncbi:hypothetical protein C0993_008094 [Termitomyces sp. T159_Od127]|nr:hypothetical protein C0993_008094 [Termitomyces sp. T159_Od127]